MQDRFKVKFWNKIHKRMESWAGCHLWQALNNPNLETIQCTGLKDKNGKLIYEGDICRNIKNNDTFSVHWHGTMAGYVWSKPKYAFNYDFGALFRAHDKYEIIGNVFENPELLEDGKCK